MPLRSFSSNDIILVGDALEIAEDATGDFFKFSLGQWKKHRYDVKTLRSLRKEEIEPHRFALLQKGSKAFEERLPTLGYQDFYLICLQDHVILKALSRDKNLGLMSLLVYVFTHELIHIVRFCNFFKRFEASEMEKEQEERKVHALTYEILKKIPVPKLDYILDSYRNHRVYDMAI